MLKVQLILSALEKVINDPLGYYAAYSDLHLNQRTLVIDCRIDTLTQEELEAFQEWANKVDKQGK